MTSGNLLKVKVSKVYFLARKQIEIGIQHTEQCLHVKAKVSPSRHPYLKTQETILCRLCLVCSRLSPMRSRKETCWCCFYLFLLTIYSI